ncbi:MAG: hypothetical protein RLZZ337_1822 [Bacteroidota bacterium]|jgi:DNA repair protein RecO (recombination protein O)
MLAKTRAIVLRNTNYSESSVISKMYTREFGMRTYLLQSIKKGKSAIRPSMIQPLSIVEMDVYEKPTSNLNRVKELKPSPPLLGIQEEIVKKTVAMFMLEIINQCIIEEQCEIELYDFLENEILILERETSLSMFPIQFLLRLTPYLGVQPQGTYSEQTPYFSLNDGVFLSQLGVNVLSDSISNYLSMLLNEDANTQSTLNASQRKEVLNALVTYFQLHITKNKQIRSIEILTELLN